MSSAAGWAFLTANIYFTQCRTIGTQDFNELRLIFAIESDELVAILARHVACPFH